MLYILFLIERNKKLLHFVLLTHSVSPNCCDFIFFFWITAHNVIITFLYKNFGWKLTEFNNLKKTEQKWTTTFEKILFSGFIVAFNVFKENVFQVTTSCFWMISMFSYTFSHIWTDVFPNAVCYASRFKLLANMKKNHGSM